MSINTKPATPWSLEALPPEEVDIRKLKRYQLRRRTPRADHVPVHNPRRGMITEQTPVASIGSCFADEILSWLHLNGYNIVRTEATGRAETDSATVQSARFGQVLNTHAMRQVLERAIGLFEPEEWCWPDRSGKLLDPYRKLVTWDSEEEAKADLETHFGAVVDAVKAARVFVATPGVAEVWRSRKDGATYASTPPRGVFDPKLHRFELSQVEENVENLKAFYRLLRDINPELQLVVTVSPVPLLATFRDMDCEVANTVSKATLRVAVDRFCQVHPEVVYFPSYELVTRMGRDAYLEDGVHVKPEVVSRIMSAFMEHFGDAEPAKETETKLVDDQADFVPAPNAKRVGIDSSSWHALRVPIASLAVVYRREVWRRAEAIAGESPIALYGGGRHTRAMIEQVPEIAARPGTIILDDKVSETEIMGVPVRTPDDVDPEAYGAVVVSSDSIQALLRERASIWLGAASTDTRIVGMYEGVDGQILPTADQVVWVSGEEAEADQR